MIINEISKWLFIHTSYLFLVHISRPPILRLLSNYRRSDILTRYSKINLHKASRTLFQELSTLDVHKFRGRDDFIHALLLLHSILVGI